MSNLRQAAAAALEALENSAVKHPQQIHGRDAAIDALRAALAEPEQPVAYSVGRTLHWHDGLGIDDAQLFAAPTPQREHITDGSPCWCNPDVIEEDGGSVIVHNYDDNWQQYAKPGETAQQCIERHRTEQDALMKLYATPRKPVELTDWDIVDIRNKWDATPGVSMADFARAVIAAYEKKQGEQT